MQTVSIIQDITENMMLIVKVVTSLENQDKISSRLESEVPNIKSFCTKE
jgi:hypothetical protein